MSQAPKKPTARQRLHPSKLHPTQLELLGDDVDLQGLYLALNHQDINIVEAVTDVTVERTIQGASTITVQVEDRDRVLLRSGRLSARNDVEIDGLFFRLVTVEKNGADLTLIFEDREVTLLRTYDKPIKQALSTSRQKLTRAQFVLRMIKEVREEPIAHIIPELTKVQPIGKAANLPSAAQRAQDRSFGIPKGNDLTVKGQPMTDVQRQNANAVLDTGVSYLVPLKESVVRKCLVMSIMCVIQESTLANLRGADNPVTAFQQDSVGLFQQRKSQGWPATRDIPTDATAFFAQLKPYVVAHPDAQYYAAIQAVQRSGFPTAYAQWRTEAERIVTAYGYIDGSAAAANAMWTPDTLGNGDYEFYRGIPPTKKRTQWGRESSWDCIQRLANEVNWRAFFVSGTFYFIADDDLIKSQPIATLDEGSEGVISMDGIYNEGAKSASLTLSVFASRWVAAPGSVIQITNMGPWNGRWLVNDISRSLFDPMATITLKKKLPRLPEPAGSNLAATSSGTYTGAPPPSTASPGTGRGAPVGTAAELALQLLLLEGGQWFDDNGKGAAQLRKTAAGLKLDGANGSVFLDVGPIRAVLWLINQGYKIGTDAWCEDHRINDGNRGHVGGYAVDISSINRVMINDPSDKCRDNTLAVAEALNGSRSPVLPRQLICGGYGDHRDIEISNQCIPAADSFYGSDVMSQHTNHIHVGY